MSDQHVAAQPASIWRVAQSLPMGMKLSGSVVLIVLICGLLNPLVDYDPVADAANLSRRYEAPSWEFIFGTDGHGRSIATRLFKAVSAFFFPGLIAGVVAVFWGGLLGALCGYLGGWISKVISVVLELIDTLPRMVFLVLVCTIFPPSITLIAFVSAIRLCTSASIFATASSVKGV